MGALAARSEPRAGACFREGARRYVVLEMDAWTVCYLDVYGREAIRRSSSRIQWDLDVAAGALRPEPEKGG